MYIYYFACLFLLVNNDQVGSPCTNLVVSLDVIGINIKTVKDIFRVFVILFSMVCLKGRFK